MRRFIVIACACLVAAAELTAQLRYRPAESGPWRPWTFTAIASARQSRAATATDVQAWQTRLQEFAAIIKRSPAVAQPIGFAADLSGHLDGYGPPAAGEPAGKDLPLAGGLTFSAFPLIEFTRNGRLMNEDLKGGETQTLPLVVNHIDGSMFGQSLPMEWSGTGAVGFTEPQKLQPVAGLVRFDDVLVVTKNPKPLWIPLSLSDAVAPVVAQRRENFESRRQAYAKEVAGFEQWQAAAARNARRAGWKQAAASMPGGGAEFLANMEKSDVEIEKAKRTQLAPGGAEDKGVQDAERELREAEAALGQRPAAAHSGASCYDTSARAIGDRFRPLDGAPASCRPLVKTNWEFFDRSLPRTAPQIVMVTQYGRCLTPQSLAETTRGGCVINRQLIESLDWEAVRAWLR